MLYYEKVPLTGRWTNDRFDRTYARDFEGHLLFLPFDKKIGFRVKRGTVVAIEFDVRDWENGFWVTFRIPYSDENWQAIFAIAGAANITVIRANSS